MEGDLLSAAEFDDWFTPKKALSELPSDWSYETKAKWVAGRLQSGLITAGARSYLSTYGNILTTLVRLQKDLWVGWPCLAEDDFWKTGDIKLYNRHRMNVADAFDVRFDPAGFDNFTPKPVLTETPTPDAPLVSLKNLSDDNAKRFSRAILEGWPDSTERNAVAKARLFFPENTVPRDWFFRIFRSIRSDRKPGKKGKVDD